MTAVVCGDGGRAVSAPVVVMHRPPLPRIETSRPPRPAEPPTVDIDCIGRFIEQERIWSLLRQSAEGCNATMETAE